MRRGSGRLLAYGPRIPATFRRAAGYVASILKGARPADLPIARPDTFGLVVDLKTAMALRGRGAAVGAGPS